MQKTPQIKWILKEYVDSYKKAKKALEKGSSNRLLCMLIYEKLNYVVPIALQCSLDIGC